jgi:hypothetical protein
MRSERKRRRTFLARFMVLFMIINLLSGVNPGVVKADESPAKNYKNYGSVQGTADNEGISINKEVLAENGDGTFDVKLTVTGAEKITKKNKKTDIVLVVDTSGSMREPKAGNYYTDKRISNAKEAATSFVNAMIKESGKGDIKIGLVSFASGAEKKSNLTNNKDSLNRAIQTLTANGGTYTQAGLNLANEILRGGDAEEKIIVLISDGKPTFADGTHPNFGERGNNGYSRIYSNIPVKGYEIWHGETSGRDGKWIGKGYYNGSKYGNYIVKLVTGKFGDGTESHHGQGAKSWPYNLMGEYFRKATISAANVIKNDKVKIYSVGIGLEDNVEDGAETKNGKKLGRDVLKGIADSGSYLDAGAQAEGLNKILESLAVDIHHNIVVNGTITDPMSKYVEYVAGSAKVTSRENTDIEVPSEGNNNTLKVSNINLDKGEKLEVTYKVKLKDNWKDGEFHPSNGETTLVPSSKGTSIKFNVPEVKADAAKTSVTIKKQWVGDKVPANVNAVKFNIKADGTALDRQIEVKKDDNWTKVINDLPKYKAGSEIKYTVEEIAGKDYVKVGDIASATDKDGNLTFTATNRNTEKINFTVKKDWANTPEELKIGVAAKLYANGKLKAAEPLNNDEAIFKDLPRYDEAGNEIKYTVKETLDVGGEEENGQITFGEYNYKVDYAYTESGATITNTSTNASTVKFDIDVIKNWVGGSSTQELNFVFKNEKDSKEYTLTMTAAGQASQDRWLDSIELPKYNDDNSLAAYTVTEKNVKGYTANVDKYTGITANSEPIEFTNTRNTRDITVTKQWKDTPENLKKDVEVVLTENGKVSSRRDAVKTIKNDAEHKVTYTNLPETDTDGNKIDYSVNENSVEAGFEATVTKDNEGNIVVTNTYKKLKEDTISVTLKKVWVGGEGNNATFNFINKKTKDAQTVVLSADTKDLNEDVDGDGHVTWTYEVKNLRKYDDDANLIDYVVEEVTNKAYTLKGANSLEVKAGDTATFTNVRVEKKLTLKKEWISEEKAPVTVIVAAGEINFDILLRNENGWKYDKLLPVYDVEGNPIQYTITEKEIQGYKADNAVKTLTFVTPAGDTANQIVTFTNTKMIGKDKNFTVHKTWVGEPTSKVSFGLFDGTNKVGTLELSAKDVKAPAQTQAVWEGTFKGEYPEYKLVGDKAEKIQYEVKELDASGNSASDEVKLEGRTFKVVGTPAQDTPNTYNFTNTDITKTDISVIKTWLGKVPESGLVHFGLFKVTAEGLVQVGKENYEVEDSNSSKWKVTFKNVASVDENGNKINYVIKEVDGEANALKGGTNVKLGDTNYKVSYDDKGNITNTELIDLTVNKEWGKNVPDIAKHSVKIRITDDSRSDMNGKSFLLNDANGWTKSFKNLPLYNAEGNEINYTVVETEINGDEVEPGPSAKKYYHSAFEITAEDAENITKSQTITIKNSIVNANNDNPDNRTINVVKGWSEGAERKPVTVKLYKLDAAKGEIVPVEDGETELREENFWQTEFTVPKNDKDGNEIIYYAFETSVGDVKIDESKLSPNMYNEGYQIGEYEVSIAELIGDAEGEEYGFYILNTADNKEVKPEEKVNINVTKKWLIPDNSEYVKPVRVRLFIKAGEYLVPVSDATDLTLDANNNWNGKFADLDKFNNDGDQIEYYVAEVGVGDYTKEITSLDQISGENGYTIGRYNAYIDGNGTDNVVISNDYTLIDVTAVKNWVGATPRQTVEFTLYTKQGENLVPTGKTVTLNGTDENTVATFAELPRLDNDGKQIVYYVYETKIGETPITFNLTPVETMNYSLGINGGVYAVTVSDNGTVGDKVVIISNSFTGIPVIPSGNIPLVPVVTPTPTPTPTPAPNPDSPVVDIPNVPSPQGPATPVNDGDEDNGVTEIDEDDVPQGDGKEVKKDNKANKDTVEITDNKAPKGTANLPKTGGEAGNFLSIIGLGLIGLGLVIRRRR